MKCVFDHFPINGGEGENRTHSLIRKKDTSLPMLVTFKRGSCVPGAAGGNRTHDPELTKFVLYH